MKRTFLILALFLLAHSALADESFGRNKVQYSSQDWLFFESGHFTVYYIDGFEDLARLAAEVLEQAYMRVSDDLGHGVEKPLPVIIYPTPGEFQQTNIIMSILGEGTGGFTESFKTRVVLPFSGSYEDFRHVLIHEMAHGVVFDKILGRGPINPVSSNRIFEMPLWLAEGISEWVSICWDVESDMYLRDAILNDYVVPLNYLSGFLAYKEGASVVNYIAKRYGRRKLGEIIGKGQFHISADAALKSAIGKDQKQLYEDWLETKKSEYFPEYGLRKRPQDIATRITEHEKDRSYFNVMPAFSPNGHTVAYLSNDDDYIDLYAIDVITGKRRRIAKGERGGSAESFHPFRSKPGWSRQGDYLAFSRKRGENDELVVYRSSDWKIHLTMSWNDIREISSPNFFPGDTALVFSALIGDRSDLFIARFDGSQPQEITADRWDDRMPSVSPNGKLIAFSSDRPVETGIDEQFPYGKYNIWLYEIETRQFTPLTRNGSGNDHPAFSPDGGKIAYTSERNGVRNIWIAEIGGEHRPYTDLLSGAFAPSWDTDSKKLVFSAFYDGGFDLYYLENPQALDSLIETPFVAGRDSICFVDQDQEPPTRLPQVRGDLRNFDFIDESPGFATPEPHDSPAKPYRPQFSVDLVSGVVGYDTYYGFLGQTYLSFSDILGNHRITTVFDLFDDIENSTIYASYSYLARRTDFGLSMFHYRDYFWDNNDRIFADRVVGGGFFAKYPLSQFERIEAATEGIYIYREFVGIPSGQPWPEDENPFDVRLSLSAVRDNSLWGDTGPLAGSRSKIALEAVPGSENSAMSFVAGRFDYRKYKHFGNGYSLALRVAGGAARGDRTPNYRLGGSEAWLNWRVADSDIYSIADIYYSRMILPLRGHKYFAYEGQTYAITNLEFRYPFVQYMKLGMPPIEIGGINGAIFADVGAVTGTDLAEFRGWSDGRLDDVKIGLGVGARAWVWWLLLSYDIAWRYDFRDFAAKPYHHLSLGGEF